MTNIQVKLSEEEDNILSIYRVVKKLKSKKAALKALILEKAQLVDKFESFKTEAEL